MRYLILFFYVFCPFLYAADFNIKIGDESIIMRVWQGNGSKALVHLHQNETTALRAAKEALATGKASGLLTLKHSGGRNIHFRLQGRRYEFDPNRIFTDKGIKASLTTYGPYSHAAYLEVKKLADAIISHLPKGRVVAVHNNRGYSIRDYFRGHKLANDAKELFLSPGKYFRNFFLVTRETDYKRLKALGFNGLLQADNPEDDGSLSVFLKKRDYINVEAGYNQLKEQIEMIEMA